MYKNGVAKVSELTILDTMHNHIFPIMPRSLINTLTALPLEVLKKVTEIRLRSNQPLQVITGEGNIFLNDGGIVSEPISAHIVSKEEINRTLQLVSSNSLYAFEEELKQGFITVKGGHRIGIAGQAIMEHGKLKAIQNISSLNIRIAREVIGCADRLMPFLICKQRVISALIISPPRCGKTTLLRDITRQLSVGVPRLHFSAVQVGVVDERSEIAACDQGVPTVKLGSNIDVLDGCPKASGMLMLIRAMSPQVIVTDELGRQEDVGAISEALHAGVSVIASVHGNDYSDISKRPYIQQLVTEKAFSRYVILTDDPKVGTIAKIVDHAGKVLFHLPQGKNFVKPVWG